MSRFVRSFAILGLVISAVAAGAPAAPGIVGATPSPSSGADDACTERILFVAGNVPAPAGDQSLFTVLEDRSPQLDCITTTTPAALSVAEAELFDAVVISSSVVPDTLGAVLKDAAVPILVSEVYLFDDMGFVVDKKHAGELTGRTTIDISDPTHPLASGHSGTVAVYDAPAAISYGLDGAAPDIEPVARTGSSSRRRALLSFDEDGELADGTSAADRRVGWFGSYGATYTAVGTDLIHAALDWLTRDGAGPVTPPVGTDGDAIAEAEDLCPFVSGEAVQFDPLQFDADHDGIGDPCDSSPSAPAPGVFLPGGQVLPPGPVGDVDRDGDVDIVSMAGYGEFGEYHRLDVAVNDGSGEFTVSTAIAGDLTSWQWPILGQFDGDGDLDLFVRGGLYRGGPGATFEPATSVPLVNAATAADIDGDGDLDVVAVEAVLINDGTGAFTSSPAPWSPDTWELPVGDVDADGDVDVLTLDDDIVWLNDGTGSFTASPLVVTDDWSTSTAAFADLDGDRDLDLVLAAWGTQPMHILRNDGSGSFTPWQVLDVDEHNYWELRPADLDGDGDLDLAALGWHGGLWHNDGSGGLHRIPGTPTVPQSGEVVDVDGDGVVEIAGARGPVWWNTGRGRVAFIAGNAGPPQNDQPIVARIEAFGAEVVVVDDDDATGFDFGSVDAVFVSTSVVPAPALGDLLAGLGHTIVIWEPHLFDELGLATARGEQADQTAVVVVGGNPVEDPDYPVHPLAAGLRNDRYRVYRTAAGLSYGTVGTFADVVAHVPGRPDRATTFQYDFRDPLPDGTTAAGTRIGSFMSYPGEKYLVDTGWLLVDAAIDRALLGKTWPPGNDDLDQAWPLTVPVDTGESCGATTQAVYDDSGGLVGVEPDPSTGTPIASVWWNWTAGVSGPVTFDASRSDFDEMIAVWTGDDILSLTEIGADWDGSVTIDALAGTTYHIAVSGEAAFGLSRPTPSCGHVIIETTVA